MRADKQFGKVLPDLPDAACANQAVNPNWFFADDSNKPIKSWVRKAKAVCDGCPLRERCLAYALKNEQFGIWGGHTARERRAMLRVLKAQEGNNGARVRGNLSGELT